MKHCTFCKIVKREIPANIVYEDEEILAFYDINPQAPVHILVIPKKHIDDLTEIEEEDLFLMGKLMAVIKRLCEDKGLINGFRIVLNTKESAGQSVFHIHFHLLAGRNFHWPPG